METTKVVKEIKEKMEITNSKIDEIKKRNNIEFTKLASQLPKYYKQDDYYYTNLTFNDNAMYGDKILRNGDTYKSCGITTIPNIQDINFSDKLAENYNTKTIVVSNGMYIGSIISVLEEHAKDDMIVTLNGKTIQCNIIEDDYYDVIELSEITNVPPCTLGSLSNYLSCAYANRMQFKSENQLLALEIEDNILNLKI